MPELLSKQCVAWRHSHAPAMSDSIWFVWRGWWWTATSGFRLLTPHHLLPITPTITRSHLIFLAVAGLGTRNSGRESLTLGSAAFEAAILEPESCFAITAQSALCWEPLVWFVRWWWSGCWLSIGYEVFTCDSGIIVKVLDSRTYKFKISWRFVIRERSTSILKGSQRDALVFRVTWCPFSDAEAPTYPIHVSSRSRR